MNLLKNFLPPQNQKKKMTKIKIYYPLNKILQF